MLSCLELKAGNPPFNSKQLNTLQFHSLLYVSLPTISLPTISVTIKELNERNFCHLKPDKFAQLNSRKFWTEMTLQMISMKRFKPKWNGLANIFNESFQNEPKTSNSSMNFKSPQIIRSPLINMA